MKEANIKKEIQRTLDLFKYQVKLLEGLLETIPDNLNVSYDQKKIDSEEEVLNVPQAIEHLRKVGDTYTVQMMTSFGEGFRKYKSLTDKQMNVLRSFAKKYNIQMEG